jgi:hypothetical protein
MAFPFPCCLIFCVMLLLFLLTCMQSSASWPKRSRFLSLHNLLVASWWFAGTGGPALADVASVLAQSLASEVTGHMGTTVEVTDCRRQPNNASGMGRQWHLQLQRVLLALHCDVSPLMLSKQCGCFSTNMHWRPLCLHTRYMRNRPFLTHFLGVLQGTGAQLIVQLEAMLFLCRDNSTIQSPNCEAQLLEAILAQMQQSSTTMLQWQAAGVLAGLRSGNSFAG